MVRGHRILAEPFGEMACRAFDRAAGVGEDQRGAMLFDQFGEAVVHQTPRVIAHHRLQRHVRQFDREVARALMAGVDDGAFAPIRPAATFPRKRGKRKRAFGNTFPRLRGIAVFPSHSRCALVSFPRLRGKAGMGGNVRQSTHQKPRHFFDGFLRRRQPYARAALAAQRIQPLQRQREMTAAFAGNQRVDFIHDHRARGLQHSATGFRAQQDVQRFRRGHHDVRRPFAHRVAFGLRGVAGAHRGADFDVGRTHSFEFGTNAFDRHFQIDAHVVGQRLQRRHVHDGGFVR